MRANKKSVCYDNLKHKVLALQLAPGMTLDETALAREHGLSRTPLREVLQQLAGEGYLTLAANRSAQVSSMDLATMRNFFQTAPMVYAAVTRLAAENATAAQIVELKDAQLKFRKSIADGSATETALLNHRFHEIIGTMAGNPYLTPSLKRLLIDHTRMSQAFYTAHDAHDRARIETAAGQHDAIIDAIESHEPVTAVELTLQHWNLSRCEIERYVYPDPLPVDIASDHTGELRDAV
jgi:DNA-binding GntR family transcriptional regulator